MGIAKFIDRASLPMVQWPAVGAGLFVALGIHIVLTAFGLGIAFMGDDGIEGGTAAIGLLLWSGLVWIMASFVGGYVAGWVSGSFRYVGGLFHGLVMWGVLTFVLMFLPPSTTMGVGAMGSDSAPSVPIISSVAWFVAIGGMLSLGSTIWGALLGSRVVEQVEAKTADTYRAA
jgi:hypothetical protein